MSSGLKRIAPNNARQNVIGQIARNRQLSAIQRCIAKSDDALVRLYQQRNEVAPRRADADARISDLHCIELLLAL